MATARAGNVIGGGDWADDRLIPDAMRALARGEPVRVRNPAAVRPWQHVLEPLGGYLVLAERLCGGDDVTGAWNFGPREEDAVPVATLVELALGLCEGGRWEAAPEAGAPHEVPALRLDAGRARARLGWRPALTLKEAAGLTVAWYRAAAAGTGADGLHALSVEQIRHYESRWRTAPAP